MPGAWFVSAIDLSSGGASRGRIDEPAALKECKGGHAIIRESADGGSFDGRKRAQQEGQMA